MLFWGGHRTSWEGKYWWYRIRSHYWALLFWKGWGAFSPNFLQIFSSSSGPDCPGNCRTSILADFQNLIFKKAALYLIQPEELYFEWGNCDLLQSLPTVISVSLWDFNGRSNLGFQWDFAWEGSQTLEWGYKLHLHGFQCQDSSRTPWITSLTVHTVPTSSIQPICCSDSKTCAFIPAEMYSYMQCFPGSSFKDYIGDWWFSVLGK